MTKFRSKNKILTIAASLAMLGFVATPAFAVEESQGISLSEFKSLRQISFANVLEKAKVIPRDLPRAIADAKAMENTAGGGGNFAGQVVHDRSHGRYAVVTIPALQSASETVQPKVKNAASTSELVLSIVNDQLTFEPQEIHLKAGETIHVTGPKEVWNKNLSVFIRDQNVLAWDGKSHTAKASEGGYTEIYFVYAGQLNIVTAQIGGAKAEPAAQAVAATTSSALTVPEELIGIDDKLFAQSRGEHASFGTTSDSGAPDAKQKNTAAKSQANNADANELPLVFRGKQGLAYVSGSLQIIDDRSVPEQNIIYPVAGVKVRIIGTEFSAITDNTGRVQLKGVPKHSILMVRVDDDSGHFSPAVFDLPASALEKPDARMKIARSFALETYQNVTSVVQTADHASFCVRVADGHAKALEGIRVQIDAPAQGPYYFNRYGLLDSEMTGTGPGGKACFLNVLPGPISMSASSGDEVLANLILPTHAGSHTEEDFVIDDQVHSATTAVAVEAPAHEQLSSNNASITDYAPVAFANLVLLGDSAALQTSVKPGVLDGGNVARPHNNRLLAYAQSGEFEPAVYEIENHVAGRDNIGVVPLLPRGFVEDMSLYAQQVQDSNLGSILIEHGNLTGADDDGVNFRLLDGNGNEVAQAWLYKESPVVKGMFFNINPGHYVVQVETREHHWVSSHTVMVYSETLSYVSTGAQLLQEAESDREISYNDTSSNP